MLSRTCSSQRAGMMQKEEAATSAGEEQKPLPHHVNTSKKVTDHLANQRTFLAWIRTGLATITFGFVVERFGLLLRELGLKNTSSASTSAIHYSAIIGVSLVILGVIMMIVALFSFLRIRRSIDEEKFHPQATFE